MTACNAFLESTPAPTPEPVEYVIRPLLEIGPDTLPEAEAGMPYEVLIQVSKNETPVNGVDISQGGLPHGLEIKFEDGSNSALISGIPQESGTYHFTVHVWCVGTNTGGQMGDKEYTLVIK